MRRKEMLRRQTSEANEAQQFSSRTFWGLLGAVGLFALLALFKSVDTNKRAVGDGAELGMLVVSMDAKGIGEHKDFQTIYREELREEVREIADEEAAAEADEYFEESATAEIEDMAEEEVERLSGEGPTSEPPLFTSPEEGDLRAKALAELKATGADAEFTLFKGSVPPRLLFSKLHKVGGTSVALALHNVTKYYNLNGGPTRGFFISYKPGKCRYTKFDVFYQHAWRSSWMPACLPDAAMVTILREPVSRYISHATWYDNRRYFIEYPDRECDYKNGDRKPVGGKPFKCHDDNFRHQFTLDLLLKRVAEKPNRPKGCGESCSWLTKPRSNDPKLAIEALENDYAMYATTEHLDEFMVILALRFGWSLDTMLYEKCKDQGKVKVSGRDLQGEHQWALDKIKLITSEEQKVYEFAKQKFEGYLDRLGPNFRAFVQVYKQKLAAFHEAINVEKNGSPRWLPHPSVMMC